MLLQLIEENDQVGDRHSGGIQPVFEVLGAVRAIDLLQVLVNFLEVLNG